MTPSTDLDRARRHRGEGNGFRYVGPRRVPHGIGQRLKVVAGWFECIWIRCEPHDLPASRRGQSVAMRGTEVVAVRFGIGRQWPQHCSGV